MTQPIATVIAALIVAVAILFVFRWDVPSTGGIIRLDRWTGNVTLCPGHDPQRACEEKRQQ